VAEIEAAPKKVTRKRVAKKAVEEAGIDADVVEVDAKPKRGRPKKTTSRKAEVEVQEVTGAEPVPVSVAAAIQSPIARSDVGAAIEQPQPPRAARVFDTIPVSVPRPAPTQEPIEPSTSAPRPQPVQHATMHKNSPILTAVRELSTKASNQAPASTTKASEPSKAESKPVKQTPETKPGSPAAKATSAAAAQSASKTSTPSSAKPAAKPLPYAPPKAKPAPPHPAAASTPPATSQSSAPSSASSKPSLANFNASLVSQLSQRGGARPGPAQKTELPKNYKSVSRKVTLAMVAAPIAIVTSWVLWERRKCYLPTP
jgi:hypothetical protein